jgi:Na+-driven multidrug efflux pump
LMGWGFVLGLSLAVIQLLAPITMLFPTTPEVQQAAINPSRISSALQLVNGVVFIGEGIMQGSGDFIYLAASNAGAISVFAAILPYFTGWWGLDGIWLSYLLFNTIRLVAVLCHQKWFSNLLRKPVDIEIMEDLGKVSKIKE